jgi:hypothetical protein
LICAKPSKREHFVDKRSTFPGLVEAPVWPYGSLTFGNQRRSQEKSMEITVTRKPLSWFTRRNNIRQKQRSEAELRELGKSLRERQLCPIWAKSDKTLLIGYGRLEAATLEGLEALQIVITVESLSEFDVVAIQSQENMLRQDLSDSEKGCIVERLRAVPEADGQRSGRASSCRSVDHYAANVGVERQSNRVG